jgi:hypothetical protein
MGRDARATWAKRVERWRASGLSAGEFAAEIGVNARTLTYWKWKLGQSEAHDESSRRAEFVEVEAPTCEAAVCEQLEVVLESGVVVRVPARFDADALRRVVAALGGA